jgi:hypothetical protein
MLETEIEKYLKQLVYEDLTALERFRVEMKIQMIRRLALGSRSAINA